MLTADVYISVTVGAFLKLNDNHPLSSLGCVLLHRTGTPPPLNTSSPFFFLQASRTHHSIFLSWYLIYSIYTLHLAYFTLSNIHFVSCVRIPPNAQTTHHVPPCTTVGVREGHLSCFFLDLLTVRNNL